MNLRNSMVLFSNPIIKREFSSSSRSLKANFLLCSYLLLLTSVLLLLWPGGGIHSVASASGRNLFALFFSTNLTLLILLVPAFSASSITFERENNTFSSLFTTLLSPFEIMFGKLIASISILVFLVLFSLPISSTCALTGGISMAFMLKVNLLLLAAAVSYGLVGLACSSLCAKSNTAIIMNYVLIMLFAGVTWFPSVLLSNLLPQFKGALQIIRSFSPYDALFFLLYPESYRMSTTTTAATTINPFVIFLIFSGALSVLAFIIFSRKIFNPGSKKSTVTDQLYTGTKKTIKRKLNWPFYLIDPLKRKKNIKKWSNPVFVAEMRSKLFANPKFVLRVISIIFIMSLTILVLVATQYASTFSADTVRMVAIVFQIGVVAMMAPSVSSGLITDEITSGTLTALRLTPLTPVKVVAGKLKATFFYALIFIVSSFFVIFAMAYLENQNVFPEDGSFFSGEWWAEVITRSKEDGWYTEVWYTYRRIVIWIVILLLSTVTFLTGGLFASSFSKTTGVATAIGYSIVAVICLVSFAPIVLGAKLAHNISFLILSVNPIAAAVQITSGNAFQAYQGLWGYNILALCVLTTFFLTASTMRTWYLFNKMD
jgi:ABC-2 type transport system permease protein